MKGLSVGLSVLASILIVPTSTEAAMRLLYGNDVERFIQTFPGMYAEYRILGITVNPQTGQVTGMAKAKADEAVRAILRKYGWGPAYWGKMQTIVKGTFVQQHGTWKAHHRPKVEEGVKKLEASPWIRDEDKKNLRTQVEQGRKDADRLAKQWQSSVHPKDMEAIEPHLNELTDLFARTLTK